MSNNRRYIGITPEMLCQALSALSNGVTTIGDVKITGGGDKVPLTAKGIRAGINEYGNVLLLIEDESFSEVMEGCVVPVIVPMFIETRIAQGT